MQLSNDWIVGFTDGEGCFCASTINNKTRKYGIQIQLEFIITQHKAERALLEALRDQFQCGYVGPSSGKNSKSNCLRWRTTKLDDLLTKIIPFFIQNPIQTKRAEELKRFHQLALLLKSKKHSSHEGFLELVQLANTLREIRNE